MEEVKKKHRGDSSDLVSLGSPAYFVGYVNFPAYFIAGEQQKSSPATKYSVQAGVRELRSISLANFRQGENISAWTLGEQDRVGE